MHSNKSLKKESFRHIVLFGDSLSDNGFEDGHGFKRSSNGRVWSEYLSEMLGTQSTSIRAWSGATSGIGNYYEEAKDWSGLLWQIENFQAMAGIGETLAIIQIGTNDLHDPDLNIKPQTVIANIVQSLTNLLQKGIKQAIVWNLNTSVTSPAYTDESYEMYDYYKEKMSTAYERFVEFNQLIPQAIEGFNSQQSHMNVVLFDVNRVIGRISTRFKNLTTPWLDIRYYPEKSGWFWYDHWHYMTETHHYLAESVYRFIQNACQSGVAKSESIP